MSSTDPNSIVLADPEGNPVPLGEVAAGPLVVILVRYFGCLPCQSFVLEVDAALDRFPDDATVVAVGGSADFQAAWLRDEKQVAMPLLLDPEQQVRGLAELGNLSARQLLLSKRGGLNYLGSMRQGLRPQKITRDTVRSPGAAVLGADLSVQWTYEGEFLGDYPTVDELVAQANLASGA